MDTSAPNTANDNSRPTGCTTFSYDSPTGQTTVTYYREQESWTYSYESDSQKGMTRHYNPLTTVTLLEDGTYTYDAEDEGSWVISDSDRESKTEDTASQECEAPIFVDRARDSDQ